MNTLTINVTDAQTAVDSGKKVTKYKVILKNGNQQWELWRRFKEFHALHDRLRRVQSDLKLPSRRILGDSFEPEFIEKRRSGLNDYIQQIITIPQIMNMPEVIEFFALKNLQTPTTPQKLQSKTNNTPPVTPVHEDDQDTKSIDAIQANLGQTEKKSVKPDDFEFDKCIGKGSFGKVYLTRHKVENKVYAIKVVSKALIKRKREERHIMAERDVLVKNTHHPFLVSLHYSFQTADKLYFVMDFVNGGELFYILQKERSFPEPRARFYAGEITAAIGYLHKLDIIYRDLKPENILIDREGHVRLTDFGLCKVMLSTEGKEGRTGTFCGTPEYLAPEVLRREAYTKAVDWWCLGSVTYEMLCGRPPFYSRDVNEMYGNILNTPLRFYGNISEIAKTLIEQLLRKNPLDRLGSLNDVSDIKRQPFFASIDWEKLEAKKVPPPWKPPVSADDDTIQIDREFIVDPISASVQPSHPLPNVDPAFAGFTFIPTKTMES
ncbi:unnamed protein product [Didymodactylos carnosus]|uniref:Uncharacterized protein n=1 Tax=Didymodactylos carnosus TaxID=1234261 RepID=A0A813ZQQ9_9BILA|nr:unnamed protein product [Didymodactylos carnosus]CAF0941023.1 unnamed protein product [Didymodactylos carnosus]CAF3683744.1 unnamed protein product [Didymodactylos carnosus]CAF3716146.1 unnamed protein product [Didymodactylos carnosus]